MRYCTLLKEDFRGLLRAPPEHDQGSKPKRSARSAIPVHAFAEDEDPCGGHDEKIASGADGKRDVTAIDSRPSAVASWPARLQAAMPTPTLISERRIGSGFRKNANPASASPPAYRNAR